MTENDMTTNINHLYGIAVTFLFLSGRLALRAADPLGTVSSTTTTTTPTVAGPWVLTAVNWPVTILGNNASGVWQRAVTATVTETVTATIKNYASGWDRFWDIGGT